jgi:hypothetical protein
VSTKGLPWWATALTTTVLVAAGKWLGTFPAGIVAGGLLAAVVAERAAFFTVLAQPPLVVAAVGSGAVLLGEPLLTAVVALSDAFPYLVATMGAASLVVLGRFLLARRQAAKQADGDHGQHEDQDGADAGDDVEAVGERVRSGVE